MIEPLGASRDLHKLVLRQIDDPDTFRSLTSPSMTHIVESGGFPVTRRGRWLLVGWSLFLIGGFALAYALKPNPRGWGTHESLGLPPCTFRALFGIPCPGCGMTTSFSHLMHGNVSQAVRASASGVVLAVVCALLIPWCWWSAFRGRLVGVADPARSALWLFVALAGICVVNWTLRLILG